VEGWTCSAGATKEEEITKDGARRNRSTTTKQSRFYASRKSYSARTVRARDDFFRRFRIRCGVPPNEHALEIQHNNIIY